MPTLMDRRSPLALVVVVVLSCGAGLALNAPAAEAQDAPPASLSPSAPSPDAVPTAEEISARMDRAEQRINNGAADGSLNRVEAHRVLEELANIKTQSNELSTRDGSLTPTDRQFINDRLNTLSRQIRWARNNDANRW